MVKGDRGKAPSGMGGLPGESGTEVVENGVEPPYSIFDAVLTASGAGRHFLVQYDNEACNIALVYATL